MWFCSLGWEDALEDGMAIHSIILAWRILMDRGAWQATVHRVEKNRTPLNRLSMYAWPQDQILSWRHSESCGKGGVGRVTWPPPCLDTHRVPGSPPSSHRFRGLGC